MRPDDHTDARTLASERMGLDDHQADALARDARFRELVRALELVEIQTIADDAATEHVHAAVDALEAALGARAEVVLTDAELPWGCSARA